MDGVSRPLVVDRETAPGVKQPLLTYLALLLFGKEPTRWIPGAWVDMNIYPGEVVTDQHSQRVQLLGPLPGLIRDVLRNLHLHMGMDIDKSQDALSIRQNRDRYSAKAVQEAVVNALAHRDYERQEPTRVRVFSNRIEIHNPGGSAHVENLVERARAGRGANPKWRNEALAQFLIRNQLAQSSGQGLPTIFKETLEIAGREPEVHADRDGFEMVIPAYQSTPTPPRVAPTEGGVEGVLLISIGGRSLLPVAQACFGELGLATNGQILVDMAVPGYVEPTEAQWKKVALDIRNKLNQWMDDPKIRRFHLFYRGPVVIAPIFGALIAPTKPLLVYHYQDGRYSAPLLLDRRFLRQKN
ncbi:MAG: SAVED domain-containing protein [Polyangiaceae bacterium]|nr:SAVED domain-containing protein [Polyangiaceae bacterium]